MENTTGLSDITFGKRSNFTWGEAIEKHEVGEYAIIEYYPHEYKDCCSTGKINYAEKEFSCYIQGNSLGRSTHSLDAALAWCIAYKHDGINTRADHYFMKMINP